jgi:hypothetical protein
MNSKGPPHGAGALASPGPNRRDKPMTWATAWSTISWLAAWAWALVAGGGGFGLLVMKGPWPLTNGWFVLLSGVAACPLTAWFLRRYVGVTVSGRVRLAAAVLLLIAGRIALAAGMHPSGPPA